MFTFDEYTKNFEKFSTQNPFLSSHSLDGILEFNSKLSKIALETIKKNTELSQEWSKETLNSLDTFTKTQKNPSDYSKVINDFVTQQTQSSPKHIAEFAEIANVVAHELHHLTQDIAYFSIEGIEDKPRHMRENPYVKYFLMPAEIEAYHIGFRAEADISGRSIEQCIKKYLDNHYNANNLNKNEYEKILVKWLNPEIKLLKGVINNES